MYETLSGITRKSHALISIVVPDVLKVDTHTYKMETGGQRPWLNGNLKKFIIF